MTFVLELANMLMSDIALLPGVGVGIGPNNSISVSLHMSLIIICNFTEPFQSYRVCLCLSCISIFEQSALDEQHTPEHFSAYRPFKSFILLFSTSFAA